jgi:hypothetical protein
MAIATRFISIHCSGSCGSVFGLYPVHMDVGSGRIAPNEQLDHAVNWNNKRDCECGGFGFDACCANGLTSLRQWFSIFVAFSHAVFHACVDWLLNGWFCGFG